MTVETGSRFCAIANRLRVKAMVVASVRRGVKKRAGQIRKLFAGAMATLTLKSRRWNGRRARLWTTDNCAFVWFYRSLRKILIRLRANSF